MKRVTIAYGDQTLCETDDVEQFSFTESDEGVTVAVKFRKRKPTRSGGSGGLMDLITAAGKKPKAEAIEETD